MPRPKPEQRYFGASATAKRYGISRTTLYRMAADKEVPHLRVGTTPRFDWEELDLFFKVEAK